MIITKLLRLILPEFIFNKLKLFYTNTLARIKFFRKDIKTIFEVIYEENHWKSIESKSGIGSEIRNTKSIVKEFQNLLEKNNINSIADIPCGDFNWMKEVDLRNINYIGIDIVKAIIDQNNKKYKCENITFICGDITNSELPKVDLILVRDCLVHFSYDDIFKSINRIKESNSKFLLTTSFNSNKFNSNITTGNWRPINLEKYPFNFPEPTLTINEKYQDFNGKYSDKSLCLWEIKKIKLSQK